MATAAEHLATYGVSVQQAHDFIFANLGNLSFILSMADQYYVTNAMLGEIVGGYTGTQVQDYFSMNGLDSSILDDMPDDPGDPYQYFIPVELTGNAASEA